MNLLIRCAAVGLVLLSALVAFEAVHQGAGGSSVHTFTGRPDDGSYQADHELAGRPSSVARPERRLLPVVLPSRQIVLDGEPNNVSPETFVSDRSNPNRNVLSTASGNSVDTITVSVADTSPLLMNPASDETNRQSPTDANDDDRHEVVNLPPLEIGTTGIQQRKNAQPSDRTIVLNDDSSLVLTGPNSTTTTSSEILDHLSDNPNGHLSAVGPPIARNVVPNDLPQYPSTGVTPYPLTELSQSTSAGSPIIDIETESETDNPGIAVATDEDLDLQDNDPIDNISTGDEMLDESLAEASQLPITSLTPQMTALRDQIRITLGNFQRPLLSTNVGTVGDIIIGNLPYGCKTEIIRVDAGRQTRINGVTCLCWNFPCGGYRPLTMSDGFISAKIGFGMQSMPGEMLGVFAFSRVPADYPMRVGDDIRNVGDLVKSEQLQCRDGVNQSMRLIGLVRYLSEDDLTWENRNGQQWSIERLVSEELSLPVTTAGEEGPIRLLALAYTIAMRESREQPIDGEFARATQYLRKFHDFALKIQNADGSWSAAFLGGRGKCRYDTTRLRTTGHIMEWLSVSLPESRLYDPQVMQSAALLVKLLSASEYRSSLSRLSSRDISAVMHALHALAIYDNRAFVPFDPIDDEKLMTAPNAN